MWLYKKCRTLQKLNLLQVRAMEFLSQEEVFEQEYIYIQCSATQTNPYFSHTTGTKVYTGGALLYSRADEKDDFATP